MRGRNVRTREYVTRKSGKAVPEGAAVMALCIAVLLGGCGYTREEKQQRKEIAQTGMVNAVDYVAEKYGFTAQAVRAEVCTERDHAFSNPVMLGCAVIAMDYEGKEFRVHIGGEADAQSGTDDYQHDLITAEARDYFADLLGYEIQEFYLDYKEQAEEDYYADSQEVNLVSELYEEGDIEQFLQRHPTNIRINDCTNQDLTDFADVNAEAAAYFERCAADCGMKAILISYRSADAWQGASEHVYGCWGIMDFFMEQDALWINSYAVFERDVFGKDSTVYNRFELQEYDGIVAAYTDKAAGDDLTVACNQVTWQDLGETKAAPVSAVYFVDREAAGEIVVYIPAERFFKEWKGRQIYIQHYADGKWRQYDADLQRTKDREYVYFTGYNTHGGGFAFAAFP